MRRTPILAAIVGGLLLLGTACGEDDEGPIPQTGEVDIGDDGTTAPSTATTNPPGANDDAATDDTNPPVDTDATVGPEDDNDPNATTDTTGGDGASDTTVSGGGT